MKTNAWVAIAPHEPLVEQELTIDEPRADEVRVRLVASGVCHTDAIVRDQWYPTPLPAVLGHEGAGVVESVGAAVTALAPGDHVLLSFSSCGQCDLCQSGKPAYCRDFFGRNFGGQRGDGTTSYSGADGRVSSHFFGQSSFAGLANVPARCAVKVDADAPLELLAPLGCGIQTGAGAVLNSLNPEAGSSIAVFGAGAVGDSAILAAVIAGCTTIIAIDVVPERLELARELGATHLINPKQQETLAEIQQITGGRGVNYAVDTTGVPAVFRQMTDALATLGHGVLVGAAALGVEATIDIGSRLPVGITVTTVVEGDSVPASFIPLLIDLYRQGRFPFDKLVKQYPLAEINQAFTDSEAGITLKPVVVF